MSSQGTRLLFVSSSGADKFNPMYEAFLEQPDLTTRIVHRKDRHDDYYSDKRSLTQKVFEKLKFPLDPTRQNARVLEAAKEFGPDYIFVVKGNQIRPTTLKKLRQICPLAKLINWSEDDMYAWHNRSMWYTLGLSHYDLVATQKSYNTLPAELPSLGAKKVLFQDKSYSPSIHKPTSNVDTAYGHDVIFVGTAEGARFKTLNEIARRGVVVHIYGSGWDKPEYKTRHPNLRVTCMNLIGEQYAEAISTSRIALGFLRKRNRDLQTSRTIEMPACGGFMLMEYSDEQANLFEPGVEAEFFSSIDELQAKIIDYLAHPEKRDLVASAGYRRCLTTGNSFVDRAREILEVVDSISANRAKATSDTPKT